MPGMNSGLNVNDPTVVAAFKAALLHQGLIALLIFAVLGLAWAGLRAWLPARAAPDAPGPGTQGLGDPARPGPAGPEPVGRQVLVIGFGNLWLFDAILQAQPKMAIGLPSQVIEPTAASSPAWVQQWVNWAGTAWSYHPVQAGAAAVWIQAGIGVWLIAAPRGGMSRVAGLASAGWGLIVWVFGESFGGLFAPGLTWLTGAPGAALLYVVAGLLIALPEGAWHSPRLGRLTLAGLGVFLAGMAVLQAWPGRGFWQGTAHGQPGVVAGMAQSMSLTPQPGFLSRWLAGFGAFDEAHGFAVNLFVVAVLAVVGAAFVSGRPRLVRLACIAFIAVCLADWVLVQDLGFLGGLGTDPNSMIPFILLATGGYLALTRIPAAQTEPAAPARGRSWSRRPAVLCQRAVAGGTRSAAAIGGACLIVLGAAPLAVAQASPNADPILAQSIARSAAADYPAPAFALTDQYGRTVTLASLRGKVVLLSFFGPQCTPGCPAGREFRQAAQLLGPAAHQVELVGIVLSPAYRPVGVLQAFDRRNGLNQVPGWRYLTGSLAQLQRVWREYGISARDLTGAASAFTDRTYVIDAAGYVRRRYSTEPGPGTAAIKSSFAVLFADAARQALSEG
jgi:cytochrome oxidase Cu insertion factor (SCO1/SenC/PrrC family)